MREGESVRFNYTGDVQSFIIPSTALYKLEVWGAGTSANDTSALGGYSKGYKKLKKGTELFVCCGGQGETNGNGGYNGGGRGTGSMPNNQFCRGGSGATHIAFVDGTLGNIGKETFDGQGLIVAGGAGGQCNRFASQGGETWYQDYGNGHGGGLSGNSGDNSGGSGGTQTSGYAFGVGQDKTRNDAGGGGGGYYGGYAGQGTWYSCGGGGSGWIGGVPSITFRQQTYTPSTSNRINNGNGYAIITLERKGSIGHFDERDLSIMKDGKEVSGVKYD